MNQAAVDIQVDVVLGEHNAFISHSYEGEGITGTSGRWIFNFVRNWQMVSQSHAILY